MSFEKLHRALVFLRGRFARKRAEIPPLAGFGIFLARVQSKFSALEFSDHYNQINLRRCNMEPRINMAQASPGAYHAMLGLEKYLASCGLESNLLNLVK